MRPAGCRSDDHGRGIRPSDRQRRTRWQPRRTRITARSGLPYSHGPPIKPGRQIGSLPVAVGYLMARVGLIRSDRCRFGIAGGLAKAGRRPPRQGRALDLGGELADRGLAAGVDGAGELEAGVAVLRRPSGSRARRQAVPVPWPGAWPIPDADAGCVLARAGRSCARPAPNAWRVPLATCPPRSAACASAPRTAARPRCVSSLPAHSKAAHLHKVTPQAINVRHMSAKCRVRCPGLPCRAWLTSKCAYHSKRVVLNGRWAHRAGGIPMKKVRVLAGILPRPSL